MALNLVEILELAMHRQASDVHLKAGLVPVIRKHGKLRPLDPKYAVISAAELDESLQTLLDGPQKELFLRTKEIDVGYGISGLGRFRVNICRQRGSVRMVIRNIPHQIPTLASLNLPPILNQITEAERGLILVTGITGSGKSSSLAAMIEHINMSQNCHIITIEDPIEFLIRDKKSIISQREIGADTLNFSSALRSALRQDPDVILIGEMRDRETVEIALQAAETGHLVLSTLHTSDAQDSIQRLIGFFEPHQHESVRRQLSTTLRAIISQRLARRKTNGTFIPCVEILVNNQRIREMIVDPTRTHEIRHAIEESRDTFGMQSFDQALMDLVISDTIEFEEALRLSTHPEDFQLKYSGIMAGNIGWEIPKMAAGDEPSTEITRKTLVLQQNLEIDSDEE